jgi:DNA polymerase-3 subunit gamma/tau
VELAREGAGSLDVVEIDAASHNGVDDARELRERAVFAPARDRYKIFILDEAHMVTQQGFNALLKIVEEPPEHVKFIFATTEPEKVLPTIRSRTHHYPFRLVPPGELVAYLTQVADAEGVRVEQGVLALVVQSGEGSVRDSLSILDQLIAGSEGSHVSLASAQALLGYTPMTVLNDTVFALARRHSYELFAVIGHTVESGHDPRRFVGDLLSHVRDMIVIQASGENVGDLFPGASDGEIQTWREQASWFLPHVLSDIAQAIAHSLSAMSGVTAPKLQLELLAAHLLSIIQPHSSDASEVTPSLAQPAQVAEPADRIDSTLEPQSTPDSPPGPTTDSVGSKKQDSSIESVQPLTLEGLVGLWPAITEDLAQQKRSLWVALSQTRLVDLEGDVVTIGFVKRGDAEVLKKPQGPGSPLPNADLLRDAILRHSGHRVRFTVTELDEVKAFPLSETSKDKEAWPTVSGASTAPDEASVDQHVPQSDSYDGGVEALTSDETSTNTASIATRGEPVVRQLLGGELVAEELLESKSDQGESDV